MDEGEEPFDGWELEDTWNFFAFALYKFISMVFSLVFGIWISFVATAKNICLNDLA